MIKLFGRLLNVEELVVGSLWTLPTLFLIGLWEIPLSILSGLLWALGGAERSNKLFRRLGVPLAISLALVAVQLKLWPMLIGVVPGFFILSIGYGIPDPDFRPGRDEGSVLGRFVCKVFSIDYNKVTGQHLATLIVRLIIFLLFWVSYAIILPFIKW